MRTTTDSGPDEVVALLLHLTEHAAQGLDLDSRITLQEALAEFLDDHTDTGDVVGDAPGDVVGDVPGDAPGDDVSEQSRHPGRFEDALGGLDVPTTLHTLTSRLTELAQSTTGSRQLTQTLRYTRTLDLIHRVRVVGHP